MPAILLSGSGFRHLYATDAASVLWDLAILKMSPGEIEPRGPVRMRW
jgi:hypothetical protein